MFDRWTYSNGHDHQLSLLSVFVTDSNTMLGSFAVAVVVEFHFLMLCTCTIGEISPPPRLDQVTTWCWVVVENSNTPKTVWKCKCDHVVTSADLNRWGALKVDQADTNQKQVEGINVCYVMLSFLQATWITIQITGSLLKMGKQDVTPSSHAQTSPVIIWCMLFPYSYYSLSILF